MPRWLQQLFTINIVDNAALAGYGQFAIRIHIQFLLYAAALPVNAAGYNVNNTGAARVFK